MSVREDADEFEKTSAKDFSLQKSIKDRMLELQAGGLVIPPPSPADVVPEEEPPLGWIVVKTQQWQLVSADKLSPDSFNPTAVYRWTRAGFDISRRPRTKEDGDQECVYVFPPAPKSPEPRPQHDSFSEWRDRVYREGGNMSLQGTDPTQPAHPDHRPPPVRNGSYTPGRGFLLGPR